MPCRSQMFGTGEITVFELRVCSATTRPATGARWEPTRTSVAFECSGAGSCSQGRCIAPPTNAWICASETNARHAGPRDAHSRRLRRRCLNDSNHPVWIERSVFPPRLGRPSHKADRSFRVDEGHRRPKGRSTRQVRGCTPQPPFRDCGCKARSDGSALARGGSGQEGERAAGGPSSRSLPTNAREAGTSFGCEGAA